MLEGFVKDRWGNFCFPSNDHDYDGNPVPIKAIVYRSYRNSLQWLIGIAAYGKDVQFVPVIAENAHLAAQKGYKYYKKFEKDHPILVKQ